MTRHKFIAAVAALGAIAGLAAPARAAQWAPRVAQWDVEEIVLDSRTPHANPYAEVTLSADLTCGERTIALTGFHDGGSTWKIRAMPEQPGACRFTTHSNDPALDALRGGFTVTAPRTHGPVRVAKTYHFSHADGTPFFPLGTTSYNWLGRDAALQDRTLATLRTAGFTKLRFGLFPKWYQYNRVEPAVFPY